jgi:DNA-binding CsgD family transcriptional regulator
MTIWHPTTPAWYLETAERVCTPKQLEVLKLASHDPALRWISDRLGITRQAVAARYADATRKIRIELEREDAA